MRILKYCKTEHNLLKGSGTLQLGTFDYYRGLNPEWSIADPTEGILEYHGPRAGHIVVGADALNSIWGGHVVIREPGSMPPPPPVPGTLAVKAKNETYTFTDNGLQATANSSFRVSWSYPNCYIFCASMLSGDEKPNPRAISTDYDSYYFLPEGQDLHKFVDLVSQALAQQITIGDIDWAKHQDASLGLLTQPVNVQVFGSAVQYVEEKIIRLERKEDFARNRITEIFVQSLFRKPDKHGTDNEFRFVFMLVHPVLGPLSVRREPKRLNMQPLLEMLST